MKVGRTVRLRSRKAWRAWLRRNHAKARGVWLVTEPPLGYSEAVEEALCFGWIDSVVKKTSRGERVQRFTPRRKGSPVSEMNKARVRRLVQERRMTKAGMAALAHERDLLKPGKVRLAPDVRRALQADPQTWRNYQSFPEAYRRIRIGWIEGARGRPEVFRTRLRHFVRMTRANKRYGMVQG